MFRRPNDLAEDDQAEDRSGLPDDGDLTTRRLTTRGWLIPPIVSIALIASALFGLVGLGLGYRLGQVSTATATAAATLVQSAIAAPTVRKTETSPVDLQPAAVSARLERAFQASSGGSWAICGLGPTIACHMLIPSVDLALPGASILTHGNADLAELDQPRIPRGRLALAANVGEGSVLGSLVALDKSGGQLASHDLRPLDPNGSGVVFFDLGVLADGTYQISLSHTPGTSLGGPATPDSYVTEFVVEG